MNKPIIVGFDPGTTAAIALVDIDGQVSHLKSSKNFKTSEINKEIISGGYPVLLATDKAKAPSKASNLANSLGTSIYLPDSDLSKEEKKNLGEGENDHERDAAASAKKAYRDNIDKILKVKEIAQQRDQNLGKLLKRYFNDENITKSREADHKNEKEIKEVKISNKSEENSSIDKEQHNRLRRKVDNLESKIQKLENEKESLDRKNSALKSKLEEERSENKSKVLKKQEIRKRDGIISDKEEKITELQNKLNKSKIREKQYKKALKKLEEGAELCKKANNKEEINKSDIRVITSNNSLAENYEKEVFSVDEVKGIELSDYFVLIETLKNDFKSVIEDYREQRKDYS